MKYQRTIICGLGLILLMASCASPQKSFSKGNYEKAFGQALKNLQKGSKNRKDRTILNSSFEEILESKKQVIARANKSSMIEDWEVAYEDFQELLGYYDEGHRYLSDDLDEEMKKMETERDQLKNEIAENYFLLGEDAYEAYNDSYDKLDAQDAYGFYEKALMYGSDDSVIGPKMDQAWEWGVINILVVADQRFGFSYDWDIDREFSQAERQSSGFVVFNYEKNEENADCVLEVVLADPARQIRDSRSVTTFSERIEDGYDTRVDTSGNTIRVPRYITVNGTVTTIREDITFIWEARVQPSGDRQLCDYQSRTIEAEERVTYEYYEWSGDNRAIPEQYKNNRNDPPRENEVIDDLIEELYDEFEQYYLRRG